MSIVECLLYVCELDIAKKSKRIILYFFQLMGRLEGGDEEIGRLLEIFKRMRFSANDNLLKLWIWAEREICEREQYRRYLVYVLISGKVCWSGDDRDLVIGALEVLEEDLAS